MLRTRKSLPGAISVFIFFGWVLPAEQLPIRLYTHADGLSHNAVRHMMRDSRGFLWFCAGDRLNRFDGFRFAAYNVGSGPSDVAEGAPGVYWVATYGGGVYRLDFAGAAAEGEPRVSAYPLGQDPNARLVNVIYRDHNGRIWAGTDNGLYVLEADRKPGEGSFRKVELGIASPPASLTEVGAFAEDREGGLWIGTSYGPVRRLADGRMVHYIPDGGRHIRFVRGLAVDRGGRVWIGHTHGFIVFLPEAQTALKLGGRFAQQTMSITRRGTAAEGEIAMPANPGASHWYATTARDALYAVWALREFTDGEILIGTFGGGLWSVNSGMVRHYTTAQGLSEDTIESLAEDIDGNRWIGSKDNGAMKLARSGYSGYGESDGISKTKVLSISLTQSGNLCVIGTQWLIGTFDGRGFQTTRLKLPPANEGSPHTGQFEHPILEDHVGEWWASSGGGTQRFAPVGRMEDLPRRRPIATFGIREGLASDLADALFEDSRGDIWIGNGNGWQERGGVAKWERKTNHLRVFSEADGLPPRVDPTTFAEDAAGDIWIGLWGGGLVRYGNGRFLTLNDPADVIRGGVRSLYRDSAGRLWVGTYYGGAGRIDQPDGPNPRLRYYTTSEGLANNHVSGFAEDAEGWLYVGTAGGVDRLYPSTGVMQHYGAPPGAGVITAVFSNHGALWIGSTAGIWRLIPRTEPGPSPMTLISTVRVSGRQKIIAELGAESLPKMGLPSGQNQIRIEFFSPDFGNSLRYQYKLGAEWSPAAEQRVVELANLAPGPYTFAVRAVRDDGAVSAAPATFSFTIAAPFWRQWWFVSIVIGLATLVIYRLHRYRVARLLELERVRLRIATDLHDDIGSTLSQISVLSEVVSQQLQSTNGATEPLSTITVLSRDLVDSLSDIVWAINPKRDHLSDLAYRMRRFAGELLSAHGVEFHFSGPSSADDLPMGADLRREVFLIFKEAVNNAARHSSCRHVDAAFEVNDGWLELRVSDDGRGFDCVNGQEGNGLANMNQRAARLDGTLDVQSRSHNGTIVCLRVPVGGRRSYISM